MVMSAKTLTTISHADIDEAQDLYPHATTFGDSPWDTVGRLSDEVPSTTKDMSAAFQWKHGQVLKGTQANDSPALENYRRDINAGWGQGNKYKDNEIYLDTFAPIGEQLKNSKK